MTSSNLSICVGPSILWTQDPQYSLDPAYTKVGGAQYSLDPAYTKVGAVALTILCRITFSP